MNTDRAISEEDAQKQSEFIVELGEALEGAESALSEIGVMELRRKKDTAGAIIHSIKPMFAEIISMRKERERRSKSREFLYWIMAFIVMGSVVHYFAPNAEYLGYTLGQIMVFCSIAGAFFQISDTITMERALEDSQRRLDEMYFRWTANGGNYSRLQELQEQFNADTGSIDFESKGYVLWWYEMEADLVDSVNGDTPGLGRWRPRFSFG